jgi:hypothetical protein
MGLRACTGMATPDEELVGEAWDLEGNRVVIPTAIWRSKVLKDHPELRPHLNDAIRRSTPLIT